MYGGKIDAVDFAFKSAGILALGIIITLGIVFLLLYFVLNNDFIKVVWWFRIVGIVFGLLIIGWKRDITSAVYVLVGVVLIWAAPYIPNMLQ